MATTIATAFAAAAFAIVVPSWTASGWHFNFDPTTQRWRQLLDVHEVALPSAAAHVFVELAAASLMEVSHRGELGHDGSAGVESTVESRQCLSSAFLVLEHAVHVTHELVGQVVHDVHGLDLAELRELLEHILVELLEVVVQQLLIDVECSSALCHRILVPKVVQRCFWASRDAKSSRGMSCCGSSS
jgi:hypothetical protein